MLKILIGDDHSALRKGVKNIVEAAFAIKTFGEATSVEEIYRLLLAEKWDFLILDIDLQGRDGFDVLRFMNDNELNTPVLVFSFHKDEQMALRAIRIGAKGYLTKDAADSEMILAIQTIQNNKIYVSDWVTQYLLSGINSNVESISIEGLSNREFQVLTLLGKGKTISKISQELLLSNSAVSTYRKRILNKLNLNNNSDLIKYCIENKLL